VVECGGAGTAMEQIGEWSSLGAFRQFSFAG
jgi:hypothetical protein